MSLEDIESGAPNMGDFGSMFGGGMGPGGGMHFTTSGGAGGIDPS